ncbi:MAG: hypothetical protein ACOCP4_07750 [Candidatus Woesearchaeota archaeon]
MNKTEIINNYLYYGYLPPKQFPAWLNDGLKLSENFDYSVKGAAQVFDKIFDELLAKYPNKKHIVLLSGGWDSRAILGALLERIDKSQIETVTFGVPGQLDYDIGLNVAKSAGVKAHAIDLRTIEFTWDKILKSVKNSPWTGVPDGLFNSIARSSFSKLEDIIWIGFLGCLFKLRGLQNNINLNDWERSKFFAFKERMIFSVQLYHEEFSPYKILPKINNYNNLTYDDALDLGIRQTKYIAPIVLPLEKWKNWESKISLEENGSLVIAPYIDKAFVKYWLTAPFEKRKNQNFFLEMLKYKFPELFALPNKANHGLPANVNYKLHPKRFKNALSQRLQKKAPWLGIKYTEKLNYLDYDEMFRKRADYQKTLNEAISYLQTNNVTPWLNLDTMRTDHLKQKENYGNAFCILIGLAANMKINYNENCIHL